MKKATALVLIGILAMVLPAGAQTFPSNHKTKIELEATDLGLEMAAWGLAEKSRQNGIELFAVCILADAKDGAVFEVMI